MGKKVNTKNLVGLLTLAAGILIIWKPNLWMYFLGGFLVVKGLLDLLG